MEQMFLFLTGLIIGLALGILMSWFMTVVVLRIIKRSRTKKIESVFDPIIESITPRNKIKFDSQMTEKESVRSDKQGINRIKDEIHPSAKELEENEPQ